MWEDDPYAMETLFLNRKVNHLIEVLLERSARPPVIIIQSDHGPWTERNSERRQRDRLAILNAALIPGLDPATFPGDATPVNTFRRVMNHVLKTRYPLLKNESFFSGPRDSLNWKKIPERD